MALVELLPLEVIEHNISSLRKLLENLPDILPIGYSTYSFEGYAPNPEDVEDFGEEGAVNRDLEVTFCPQGRVDGPPVLRECGPGLVAITGVLLTYIRKFPQNAVLQKWVFDLTDAAKAIKPVSKNIFQSINIERYLTDEYRVHYQFLMLSIQGPL